MSDDNAWGPEDSADLYGIDRWGAPYFSIDAASGNIRVHPDGPGAGAIDLYSLAEELQRRAISLPILLRFNGILRRRIAELCDAFRGAMEELGYQGQYRGVYPIKVNQQRHIVEEIVRHGHKYHFGLEAGSKPELMAVLALVTEDLDAPIICNGYKDEEFLEMIMLATKMGRNIIPVVEKYTELETILKLADTLNVRPHIGLRLKLATPGAGRWVESGGDHSKFGLTIAEVLKAVRSLETRGMLDSLSLIHFHLGSQITDIRTIRQGIQEATRVYVELRRLGADIRYMDAGGGLAVDYDGTKSTGESSSNYDLSEYAYAIVQQIMEVCDEAGAPHPTIITESGRAVASHHAVLLFDVLGVSSYADAAIPELTDDDHEVLHSLVQILGWVNAREAQSALHEATYYRNEALSRFRLGVLSLEDRARAENLYWAVCRRCLEVVRDLEYIPKELSHLERQMADSYFGNVSIFQSMPDSWAVDQLFPIMPIHRLGERPVRRGVLADLTCDSDGRIDKFISPLGPKEVLELHAPDGKPYLLGVFLVGAYQEILGDMHNLFGDTNAVHLDIEADGQYHIRHVVKGDSVSQVLEYVEFGAGDMMHNVRLSAEAAVRKGLITLEESAHFLRRYEENLSGYTYME